MKLVIVIFLSLILLLSIYFNFNKISFAISYNKGSFADEINFIRYPNENVAYNDIINGNIDTYLFQIPLQLIEDARKNTNLKIYEKDGLSYGILINPANSTKFFNPFSIKEIRYALNFLIDRDFIVNEILKGYGNIIVEPYGSYSPEYQNIIGIIEPLKIRYDPQYATNLINEYMEKAGAKKDTNDHWMYNNTPVTIRVLIRTDDTQRKTFGDLIATELEKMGFLVIRDYGDLNKANQVVYSSNPLDLGWNLYTESFIASSFSRYDTGTVTQMYAPWLGNLPGSQNPSFWQYSNSTIDKITQNLNFNNYTSKEDRDDLLKNAEKIGIQEAVRIFFARSHDPYIASNKISGLINDYSSGIANKFSFINAKKIGTNNNTLNIGMKAIYQGAWNNVDGCKDFFCRPIYSLITDDGTFSNPYTGDPVPFRNNWTSIISDGPHTKVSVPNSAVKWNSTLQSWTPNTGPNATALTKITIHPLFSLWHDGMPVDKYDLMYTDYFPSEWATNTKNNDKTFDAEYSAKVLPSLPLDKGIHFYDNGTFDSYIDLWHFDKKQLPAYGTLWPSEPWEITAATERLVESNKLAYSNTDANIKQIEQLSLIIPSHADLIKQELQKMIQEKYIPNPLKGFISIDYAIQRYNASIKWIEQHNNAVIGNGPFYLSSYNPSGGIITLKKFKDESYPFQKGFFSTYENPANLKINKINVTKFLKIGSNFQFSIQYNGTKNNAGSKPNIPIVRYFISDRNDDVIINGSSDSTNNSTKIYNKDNLAGDLSKIILNIKPSETRKIIAGPARLEMFITSEQSLKPIVSEYTLIARP